MAVDLTGQRFGLLVVTGPTRVAGHLRWACRCDCGGRSVVRTQALTYGNTLACGCRKRSKIKALFGPKVRLWRIWHAMRQRCSQHGEEYDFERRNYAGRGITVCAEWEDYDRFASWAHANGYADDLSIDRRDNDGNYEPSNCWWADDKAQARNTRRTIWVDHKGRSVCLAEAVEDLGLDYHQVYNRHVRGGRAFQSVVAELSAA